MGKSEPNNWRYPNYTPGVRIVIAIGKYANMQGVVDEQYIHNGGEKCRVVIDGLKDNRGGALKRDFHCKNLTLI